MFRRFTVRGIAALIAIVVATMVAGVSPSEAWTERTSPNCTRTCQWKCSFIGAFNRCLGKWVKQCSEPRCFRHQG